MNTFKVVVGLIVGDSMSYNIGKNRTNARTDSYEPNPGLSLSLNNPGLIDQRGERFLGIDYVLAKTKKDLSRSIKEQLKNC